MDNEIEVYIVLRQSPDWKSQTYKDLEKTREFCRGIGRPETLIIDRVKLWDRTLGINFFAFRQIMKDISLKNFGAVRNASLVEMNTVRRVLKRDAFYLFTDDDDWYHPEIAAALARFSPRTCAALHWDSVVFSDGIKVLKDGMFWSDNYAVSGQYLLQRSENLDIVCQHYRADGAFRARTTALHRRMGYKTLVRYLMYPGYRIQRHIDDCLSVENKHPGSTVVLEQLGSSPSGDDLKILIRNIMDGYRARPLPAEFRWMKPLADGVYDLCERLLNEKPRR